MITNKSSSIKCSLNCLVVTTVEKDEGSFDAVKIELADKTGGIGGGAMINLTITEPHGMIVVAGNGGEQQIIKANLVDVGHKMLGQEGRIYEVVKIEPMKLATKYKIVTESNNVLASGVLTSAY